MKIKYISDYDAAQREMELTEYMAHVMYPRQSIGQLAAMEVAIKLLIKVFVNDVDRKLNTGEMDFDEFVDVMKSIGEYIYDDDCLIYEDEK